MEEDETSTEEENGTMIIEFHLGGAKLGEYESGTITDVRNDSLGCCVVMLISEFLGVGVDKIFDNGKKMFYIQAVSLLPPDYTYLGEQMDFTCGATFPLRLFNTCRNSVLSCREMGGTNPRDKITKLMLVLKETNREEPWYVEDEMAEEAWRCVRDDPQQVWYEFHYFTDYRCASTKEKCICWRMEEVYQDWIRRWLESGCQRFMYPTQNLPRCEGGYPWSPPVNWLRTYTSVERMRCVKEDCVACWKIERDLRWLVWREYPHLNIVLKLWTEIEDLKEQMRKVMDQWGNIEHGQRKRDEDYD